MRQPTPKDYQALAAFRAQLRRFFAFSARAASEAGVAPQQYQALLAIMGHEGERRPSISDLAAQLLIKQHTAVELAKRLDEAGLVVRERDPQDGRVVLLSLAPKGESVMKTLAGVHLDELRLMAPVLAQLLEQLRET